MSSHDPFDEHESTPTKASPFFHTKTRSANEPGSSKILSAPPLHSRSQSEEFEDHMEGSIYAPHDICPRCNYPRMSSVCCPVSQLHHGTDQPFETPQKKKGLFERMRQSLVGSDGSANTGPQPVAPMHLDADAKPSGPPAETVDDDEKKSESSSSDSEAAQPTSEKPKSSGWTLFKSAEEKAQHELKRTQNDARKSLSEEEKAAFRALEKDVKEFERLVKDAMKKQAAERAHVEEDALKKEFEAQVKQPWKKAVEELEKQFKRELDDIKKAAKKK